jgi:hypothetical protein
MIAVRCTTWLLLLATCAALMSSPQIAALAQGASWRQALDRLARERRWRKAARPSSSPLPTALPWAGSRESGCMRAPRRMWMGPIALFVVNLAGDPSPATFRAGNGWRRYRGNARRCAGTLTSRSERQRGSRMRSLSMNPAQPRRQRRRRFTGRGGGRDPDRLPRRRRDAARSHHRCDRRGTLAALPRCPQGVAVALRPERQTGRAGGRTARRP